MLAVEHGLGLSFVSRLAVADRLQSGRLVALSLSQSFPRRLFFIWHKQKYHSAALRRFLAFCRSQQGPEQARAGTPTP
ncbi:putative DNA-binding transcriptional regulator [compost metagenome]